MVFAKLLSPVTNAHKTPHTHQNPFIMLIRFLLPVCALSLSTAINAQDGPRQNNYGIGLHYGHPFGEHAKAHPGGFLGVHGYLAFPISDLPLDYGFGFAYDQLDYSSRPITVRFPDFQTYNGKFTAKNQAYGVLPFLRYRPLDGGAVMPYAEVFAGARLFMTRSQIELEYDHSMAEHYQKVDVASAYGVATGVMVHVGKQVYLHMRYERSWGGRATQVDLDSIHANSRQDVSFGTYTTYTGAWRVQVGLVGYF